MVSSSDSEADIYNKRKQEPNQILQLLAEWVTRFRHGFTDSTLRSVGLGASL